MIKNNQKILHGLLHILDGKNVILAACLAWMIKYRTDTVFANTDINSVENFLALGLLLVPFIIIAYKSYGLYEPMRGQRFWSEAIKIVQANTICFSILLMALYFLKLNDVSRMGLVLFWAFAILLTVFERYFIRFVLRYIRKQGFNQKHILVVGTGHLAMQFRDRVKRHREFGFNIIGFLGEPANGIKVLGAVDDLEKIVATHTIDEVVIAISLEDYQQLARIIYVCEKYGLKTLIIPAYLQYVPARPQIIEFEDIPLINIREVPLDSLPNKIIKRAMDIVLSSLFILVFSPIIFCIAAGVRLTSSGPILFGQERLGLGGKPFLMYKFRSMHMAADDSANTKWTVENDPRRTKFGEFVRKTSLDELPQFFNVLKGDMSMIGPRPERPFFVDKFKEEVPKYMVKHQVKPGITGWAQVNGWRGDTSILERIKCDLYYIENWSIWLDIKIIFLTALNGLVNKNAY